LFGFENDADAKCYPERTDVDAKIKTTWKACMSTIPKLIIGDHPGICFCYGTQAIDHA
jgi:hypothetical protein